MAALSSSAHPAEALLSRARQLSSSAYHRSRTATPPPSAPTAFAEGEEFNLSISRPASPSLPSATIASFTLHEHHRNSFNGHLREHSRKRSSPHMRSSSSSIGRPLSNGVSANSSVDNLTKLSTAHVADLSGENAVKPLSSEHPSHILSFDNNACTHVPHGPGVCPTSRHSLTITAQPGDISLYSHSCVATSSHLHPVDAHRRHRSENSSRGGLVLDLLEALRHSDSDSARLTSAQPSPPIESAPSPISQSGDAPTTIHTPSPHGIVQQRTRADSTPVPSSLAIASLVKNTTDDAAALSPGDAPTSPMSLTSAGLSIAATTGAEPGLKHDLNAPALPESSEDHVSNGPSDQQAKEDTLQNTTATADVTTPPTTPTNTLTPKRSRRSSKLFGKLVPKFLQTSLGPSNSVSQSPQSAHPTSSSPSRLGRLGRSASFAGGSSSSLLSTRSVTKPDPVMEEDEEDSNKERAGLSVATTSETASSETASINDDTLVKPGSPDISIVDSGCDQTLESDRQEEAVDDDADGYQYNIVKETEDYHSPYIIDENCDDDFFLNSVLRKKSQPSSPSMLSTAWSSSPSLERMPSLTFSTDSTMSSSHSSLTSSTPSPTTPTHSFSIGASSPRSYALSVMIQPGLDEKRSRLTDAVREWRRSTNASAGSVHSSYSGFAM